MSYQLNSARDANGDEQQFMERFTQNRAAIENYKRQHGGDLERAYRAVTGQAWPAGRSVKIHNGQPEMTKDRTVKSVLGKYVAPIGAGALTALTMGGAAPGLAAMFGGGGGATAAGTTAGAATAAGGTGAGAVGGITSGILGGLKKFAGGSIFDVANRISPILGGAADARAKGISGEVDDQIARDQINQGMTRTNQAGMQNQFEDDLAARQFQLAAPRRRLGNSAAASMAAAGPVKANWGGPGSGASGQALKFTGGANAARDPRMAALASDMMDKELQAQLSGQDSTLHAPEMPMASAATPKPKSGMIDKLLGAGAFGSGILGALGTFKRPPQQIAAARPALQSPGMFDNLFGG